VCREETGGPFTRPQPRPGLGASVRRAHTPGGVRLAHIIRRCDRKTRQVSHPCGNFRVVKERERTMTYRPTYSTPRPCPHGEDPNFCDRGACDE